MLRQLISSFNSKLVENLVPSRRKHAASARVSIAPHATGVKGADPALGRTISAETVDLSRSGIAFTVPTIRISDRYLVGQGHRLNVEIDLPQGRVRMEVVGRRYEKVGIDLSVERFEIGAEIVAMAKSDRLVYEEFIKNGDRQDRRKPAVSLGLEADR